MKSPRVGDNVRSPKKPGLSMVKVMKPAAEIKQAAKLDPYAKPTNAIARPGVHTEKKHSTHKIKSAK